MKACCDCRYVSVRGAEKPRCEHPLGFAELPDYYRGKIRTVARLIDYMRTAGACGPDAQLFERRLDLVEG